MGGKEGGGIDLALVRTMCDSPDKFTYFLTPFVFVFFCFLFLLQIFSCSFVFSFLLFPHIFNSQKRGDEVMCENV